MTQPAGYQGRHGGRIGKYVEADLRVQESRLSYEKVFGAENVNFIPIAALEDIIQAERLVLGLLSEWRVRGVTGRKNEWLCGVSAEKVRRIAISALVESGLPFQSINE